MASFMEDLWGSVFTAGPNPTLIIATNATFACLQLLLGGLFVATYSIHFAILSVLSAGLWGSINWFAAELARAQGIEEEAERLRERKKKSGVEGSRSGESQARSGAEADCADDEGEDTETEGLGMRESGGSAAYEASGQGEVQQSEVTGVTEKSENAGVGSASTGLQVGGDYAASRQRRISGDYAAPRQQKVDEGDRSGEVSTDSEWEKVDGGR
ncbi:hypothetical protein LTR08_005699 [Meristemomyces frigidus]|nr:hypothetical protein LTR08_005699 [Meristemomyces frigidus]